MDYPKELRTLSFCSGYGGIERGLELAGIRIDPLAYVEIEAFAIANLVEKMENNLLGIAPIWTDVKTFESVPFFGMVDIITGGFPCQPFSAAGNKKADSDPRHIFPHIKNAIAAILPRFIFLENVDGIASAKLKGNGWADPPGTPVLLHILRELERLGYKAAAGCYSAAEMGATHKRRRWFIMGHSESQQGYEREPRNVEKESCQRGCFNTSSNDGGQPLEQFWPLPPGPHQWEWEEPRTAANPNTVRELQPSGGKQEQQGRVGNQCEELAGSAVQRSQERDPGTCEQSEKGTKQPKRSCECGKCKIKPGLGGTVNGAARRMDPNRNRIDRLRLLGNGVVPQMAGRAFLELFENLTSSKE